MTVEGAEYSANCPDASIQRIADQMEDIMIADVLTDTLGTVGGNYSGDPVGAMTLSGVLVPVGVRGYAELVGLVAGVTGKTIRNILSGDDDLKARWQALVSRAECTHLVMLLGGSFSIPARLTAEAVDWLRAKQCDVVEIADPTPTPTDEKRGRGRPRKHPATVH